MDSIRDPLHSGLSAKNPELVTVAIDWLGAEEDSSDTDANREADSVLLP